MVPRFSLGTFLYLVIGIAVYASMLSAAFFGQASWFAWIFNALGLIYGTLLYATSCASLYITFRITWLARKPSEVAVAIPFVFLPTFIGVVGLLHGYMRVYRVLAISASIPKPSEMFYAHAMVLVCLLVGLIATLICFTWLAIAMLVKQWRLWEVQDVG